jgi:hypothetical protein
MANEANKNQMDRSIQTVLDQISTAKNWNNILLRISVRRDLKSLLNYRLHKQQNEQSENSERILFEYLHNLTQEQLIEFRERVFKLTKDKYYELLIKKYLSHRPKPRLKQILPDIFYSTISPLQPPPPSLLSVISPIAESASFGTNSNSSTAPSNSNYILKCNLIRDVIECLDSCTAETDSKFIMPDRCTDLESDQSATEFPLGKRSLEAQLDSVKCLYAKLVKHQNEIKSLKKFTYEVERLEKGYAAVGARCLRLQRQNQFLKFCMLVLCIVLVSFLVCFLLMNCFMVHHTKGVI